MSQKNHQKEEDLELFKMLQLMTEMGLSLKVDSTDNKTLVSSFDKTLIPFLTEIQPKIEKPDYDTKQNYRKEFWKVFITNEILVASLKEIAMEKVIMEQKVQEYEKIYNELETQIRPKRKKRRTAQEILKNYTVSDWNYITYALVPIQRLQQEVRLRRESQSAHQEKTQGWQ